MKKLIIGVDVSKLKLDICVLDTSGFVCKDIIITNQYESIIHEFNSLLNDFQVVKSDLLISAEHTGKYTYPLCYACTELSLDLWLENPSQIKHSCGIHRGKNDKQDAYKIAGYALRYIDKFKVFQFSDHIVQTLKELISERSLYVADRAKYQAQLVDQQTYMPTAIYLQKKERLQEIIHQLDTVIKDIEKQMQVLIQTDPILYNQFRLLCSVDGIGARTSLKMIVETNGFKDFTDPRKFCCHAGVAPFEQTSGSSMRTRSRVSHRADKSIKALLHMAALCAATKIEGELKEYYKHKINQGKNKMSVLNAIRAKLIHRMFAVIKRNEPYQKIHISLA